MQRRFHGARKHAEWLCGRVGGTRDQVRLGDRKTAKILSKAIASEGKAFEKDQLTRITQLAQREKHLADDVSSVVTRAKAETKAIATQLAKNLPIQVKSKNNARLEKTKSAPKINAPKVNKRVAFAQVKRVGLLVSRVDKQTALFNEYTNALKERGLTIRERLKLLQMLETLLDRQQTAWERAKSLLTDRQFLTQLAIAILVGYGFYRTPLIFNAAAGVVENAGNAALKTLLGASVLAALGGAAYIAYKVAAVGAFGPLGLFV
jgi:hypothetical protein